MSTDSGSDAVIVADTTPEVPKTNDNSEETVTKIEQEKNEKNMTKIKQWNAGDVILAQYPPDPTDMTFYNAKVIQHKKNSDKYLILYTDREFQGEPAEEVQQHHIKEATDNTFSSRRWLPNIDRHHSRPQSLSPKQTGHNPSTSHTYRNLDEDQKSIYADDSNNLIDFQAFKTLDNLDIEDWDLENRAYFLQPQKWQERAIAIKVRQVIFIFCLRDSDDGRILKKS